MSTSIENKTWTNAQILLLRVGIVFFGILSIPFDLHLYSSLGSASIFSFENLFQLATYRTSFITESLYAGNHFEGFYNWLIALVLAVIVALVWNSYESGKAKPDYSILYYWFRVVLRYRLALAVIFTGIVKIFPIQIPDPTLSDLHTEYGDLVLWKLYYLTNAVSTAGYIPVIGALEIVGGLFLLHRKTIVIGAGLLLAVLLNVVLVNFVYEIGEQVYSSFLFLIAAVLLVYDGPRLYTLLFKEAETKPDLFVPSFTKKIAKVRPYLQVVFLVVISFFSVKAYATWNDSGYPFPSEKGIADVAGIYDVKEFVLKGDTIPYSLVDSVRWQNVVFEKWNTLSVRENSHVKVDSLKPRITASTDRNYEYLGNGGRQFYAYDYKKAKGNKKATIQLTHKIDGARSYNFSFEQVSDKEISLKGVNEKGDSLSVKLERTSKKYLLREGRRKPIKIY